MSRRDMRDALRALTNTNAELRAAQANLERVLRPPKWLRLSDEEAAEEERIAREQRLMAIHRLESMVMQRWRKYIHVRFALATPLPPAAAACFVACPPQITYPEFGAAYTPSSYINVLFIPCRDRKRRRVHRNRLARACYGLIYPEISRRIYALPPRVKRVLDEAVAKYVAQGKTEIHAFKLGIRDVVRVFIGSIWLVWSCAALKLGVIKEIVPPYHIRKGIGRHTMIDPRDVVTRISALEDPELIKVCLECSWSVVEN